MPEKSEQGDPILRMEGIEKEFSGIRALDGVDFDLRAGEVHALIGENGAGKSTLMNVLAGRFDDYRGRIVINGRERRIHDPRQARAMGIAVIYQDLSLVPNLTVAENIMLGEERAGRWTRRIDRAAVVAGAREIIDYLGFDLDPLAPVEGLGTARQCLVEIAGAVRRNVNILVFDEPTASLGHDDVEKLFRVIRDLKSRGLGMVYISHRLAELPAIADRVTVLRDGRKVGVREIEETRISDLTRMMLGHDLAEVFPAKTNRPGEPILAVESLTRPGSFEKISFELCEGEILGIAGLVGSGRTEIVRALFGADRAAGSVTFEGKPITRRSPFVCRGLGIGLVPENRKIQGNITGRSVRENITVAVLDRISGLLGFLAPHRVTETARHTIEEMKVDPPEVGMEIQNLSGGNQQKVVVGRWLAAEPRILIFDEPTQGIDVGTKSQIYKLIANLAAQGRGIILISSELIELSRLADRVLVLQGGRIVREMTRSELDEDSLFAACVRRDEPAGAGVP